MFIAPVTTMLATFLLVCLTAGAQGAREAENMTAGVLVEEQRATGPQPQRVQEPKRQSTIVAPIVDSDVQAPTTGVSKTPGVEPAPKNELMFGWSPIAVPGGLEVAVVTVTSDGLPVNSPLLPPELAALMPQPEHEDYQFQLIQPRRKYHRLRSHKVASEGPPQPPTPVDHVAAVHRTLNVTASNTTTTYNAVTHKRHTLERFMRFISKNRELLKHLMQSHHMQQSAPGAAVVRGGVRGGFAPGVLVAAAIGGLRGHRRRGRGRSRNELRHGRFRASSDESSSEEQQIEGHPVVKPLDAKQLDMAPARGTRVANMRLRGRICDRSVLNPEGPKYNSQGRIYKMGTGSNEMAHFSKTKAPSFLIPICCNCCSKSVLGCE
ncbi:uncharacterized protein LOC126373993 [Pectinophora gossypiella]|uniref:uncharacterized protein LOC126373993 n=1 Tax=Pectinophora gossypiella TaxID=13191 RepID=UPI00214DF875|nr:uncharacterized protein LOC126373993 [Pectinophora gossypiella]